MANILWTESTVGHVLLLEFDTIPGITFMGLDDRIH